jgi:hypothetical protein
MVSTSFSIPMHTVRGLDNEGVQQLVGTRSSASSSEASSSPPGATTVRGGRRLTPDTGSEDEDEDELEVGHGQMRKPDHEEYELQEGIRGKEGNEGPARRLSDGCESSLRRQRRQLYNPEEERSVVRKFDRKLVVFLAGLYLLSFLDRSSTVCSSPLGPMLWREEVMLIWIHRHRQCPHCRHGR